jgi:hypothetical protein
VTAHTWHGRRGAVLLGPTEHRVAGWLRDRTHHGRIKVRTVDLATELRLERSEAYRITARLRALGLFGIQNDRGGTRGGRFIWRTSIEHDGAELDRERHREAWARIVAWARGRKARLAEKLADLRATTHAGQGARGMDRAQPATPGDGGSLPSPGGTFAELMRRHGLGDLMDQWRVTK